MRSTVYPCLCLCLRLEQITKTRLFRRTILQFLQIFLTDERTFIHNTNVHKQEVVLIRFPICLIRGLLTVDNPPAVRFIIR